MLPLPAWTAGVHHDGSEVCVSRVLPALGDEVTVRVRVPASAPVRRIYLRTVPDGEAFYSEMEPERATASAVWWAGTFRATMPLNPYRFKLMTDDAAYYLNGLGLSRAESPDLYDFKLLADYAAPEWVLDSVFYHIFVDRFYNGDPSTDVPPGAWQQDGFTTQRRAWGAPPLPWKEGGNLDFYGGDLPGIEQKLDYLRDLGVNTVYLTPIFTARTNHRYDTLDFDEVDPHVGGNAALASLREALDRAGMRIALDIVVNHIGWTHPWFTAAQADPNAPSAEYFTFYQHPTKYEDWLGHGSLVKLNYRSDSLRDRLYRNPDSILRRWLHAPYRIDAWRLDVFHMMARQGSLRLEHKVGREIRRAVKGDRPEVYLYGEHSYDGTPHLQGDELDATMNYQGFAVPLRRWFSPDMGPDWPIAYLDPAVLPAEVVAEQWRMHQAATPWVIARQQYHMLGSHDVTRILTMLGGDKALLKAAVTVLLTYPGVPAIYYGDEIGMEGGADPDNRRAFPWDEREWGSDLRAFHRTLIRLRRSAPALVRGGLQMLAAEDGLLAYQRQSAEQQLVVVAWRGPGPLETLHLPVWSAGIGDGTRLTDLLSGERFTVAGGHVALHDLTPGSALVLEAGG